MTRIRWMRMKVSKRALGGQLELGWDCRNILPDFAEVEARTRMGIPRSVDWNEIVTRAQQFSF
jgi:hypothetical protein